MNVWMEWVGPTGTEWNGMKWDGWMDEEMNEPRQGWMDECIDARVDG